MTLLVGDNLTLRHTKGRREDVMPLPLTTGQAIAAYLRHERPKTRHRGDGPDSS
jgi:hypothetical protein